MTNGEIKTAIRDDLSIATGDAFYSDAYIQRVVIRAVKWLAALHFWQQTQFAYKMNSVASQEFYNYPEDFRTDSIWKLIFNGENYDRKSFAEYLRYQSEEGSNAQDLIYSDHQRKFFINPAPASIAEICVYGHLIPATMSLDADTHPFSGEAKLEEAIVKYAQGLCLQKGRGTNYERGINLCEEAEAKAEKEWDLQKREQSKYQTKDLEMFTNIPILPINGGQRPADRGNFVTFK